MVLFFSSLQILSLHAKNIIQFDIKSQRADQAIIAFAQKANQTILFSFDLTKKYQANSLRGTFTMQAGLTKLLKGTGLVAIVSANGQFTINKASSKPPKDHQDKGKKIIIENIANQPANNKSKEKRIITNPNDIEHISIVGSRAPGRSVNDLPVAVDILTSNSLTNTGQSEVGRMLQALAPSFNFSSSTISDGSDAIRPATLRGLGPDQTLVLVNGKRRHQASLIHINTSVGRGTTGTDMNAIPSSAIKRIEVLRDGAAAQYGSDAIAGVINIVLNDSESAGTVSFSYGQTGEQDGATSTIDLTKGFALGSKGFINTTLNIRNRDYTNRAGLHGSCQFPGCTTLADGSLLASDPREITANRSTFRIGDAISKQVAFTLNSNYNYGEGSIYGFITYSKRESESAAFFRQNNDPGNTLLLDGDAVIPEGFLPKINSTIEDGSINFGYKTDLHNDNFIDFSFTSGKNTIDYITSDTINASYANFLQYGENALTPDEIRAMIPRKSSAYGLSLGLYTLNIDYQQTFEQFTLATGTEIRTDTYQVSPGEKYAYYDYDSPISAAYTASDYSAGTQGFGGISERSLVNEKRHVFSVYADIETDVTENLRVSTAVHYDNYDGLFKSTSFKIAGHWVITPKVSFRSSLSTGFRAPSMQQLYFNNISTQFLPRTDDFNNDQVAVQVGTFRNDSKLAQAIGIPTLKEENALNFSLGSVIKISESVNLTVDFYAINIDDRIVISDKLGYGLSPALDAALTVSNTGAGQFFLNGANTETSGLDIIGTWRTELYHGELNVTLAANYTDTQVTKLFTPTGSDLGDIAPEQIFSQQDVSIIEEWQPTNRVSFSSFYKIKQLSVNLLLNRYGNYAITDGGRQVYNAELITDLRVNYQINKHLAINVGSNNLFNVTPDKNEIGNSRAGTIVDNDGNTLVSSTGVFTYSRRSAPFGFNGVYYYAGIDYQF